MQCLNANPCVALQFKAAAIKRAVYSFAAKHQIKPRSARGNMPDKRPGAESQKS